MTHFNRQERWMIHKLTWQKWRGVNGFVPEVADLRANPEIDIFEHWILYQKNKNIEKD
jgi:hypothetical protein